MLSGLKGDTRRRARDAARLGLQSAVAALVVYLSMRFGGLPERFVGVLSAVLVVEPSVGSTMGAAWQRVSATMVGSAIGLVCLVLLPGFSDTLVALTVSMFVLNGVAGFRPEWRYGVVAAVALSLGGESEPIATAIDRLVAIAIGVGVGVLVSLTVWPDRAEDRAERHLRLALGATARRLSAAVTGARGGEKSDEGREQYHAHIDDCRGAADAVKLRDSADLEARIEQVERLYHSAVIVNRVSEETESVVGDHEKDLASSIEDIRELACTIVEGLADGRADFEAELGELSEALDALRDAIARSESDPRLHVLRNALVFGLDEVQDSLKRLADMAREAG